MLEPFSLSEIVVSFLDPTPRTLREVQELVSDHMGYTVNIGTVHKALARGQSKGTVVHDGNTYREPDDALSEARFTMPVLAEADHA